MAFPIEQRDFTKTWATILPYLNQRYEGIEATKMRDTAKKAVYTFLCRLCNRGIFKVGLNTKIEALDDEHDCDSDVGGYHYGPELGNAIAIALREIKDDAPDKRERHAACPSCQCSTPFNNAPTPEQKRFVEEKIVRLYRQAQGYMNQKIGSGWLALAKLWPFSDVHLGH